MVEICRLLEGRGISTFLDEKDLVPGQPWPDALEQALAETGAVAVFLGRDGLGAWQKREMWFALDRQAQAEKAGAKFPVIPILLPGANPSAGFLFLNTWVDLRRGPDDLEALDRLARALHDGASTESKEPLSSICPYRGLEPFGEEDAAFFCGREAFSDRLLEAALKSSFVAVVGPSGSGKSSVVHAGLIPRLRRQRPPAPAWDAVSFTPGERPYHRLAAALLPLLEPEMSEVDRLKESAKLGDSLADRSIRLEDTLSRILEKSKGTGRLLLVADQFEELFTLTTGAAIWKRFADDLLAVTEKLPITLVLALRADFYDRALTFSRELSDRLEGALVNLGPMRREELARAIQEPATRVGLEFELGLVGRILDDVREEPGNLPLLEFALTELWARRSGGSLTNNAYRESGEVAGAIAQRAERDFEKLSPEQQRAAHRVFTELVRVARPEDGSRDTRRRAKLEDFEDAAQQVVARLAAPATRLLVTGRDEKGKNVVEVAHEALIQTWERLRRWLDEDLDFLLWRERLRAYLSDHERSGALLSGGPLAEANQWLGERRKDLGAEEATFIAASIKARDTERAAQARRQRRLILAGLGVAVLIAVLGAIAGWQAIRAKRQAEEARVDSILALQDSIQDPAVMALLALEIDPVSRNAQP
ncbi:MAG: TIR domain-containing protein [Acidobacteria bacterium]|nr:TIR domain-containing protein [Acidobacteriota bacterium]